MTRVSVTICENDGYSIVSAHDIVTLVKNEYKLSKSGLKWSKFCEIRSKYGVKVE